VCRAVSSVFNFERAKCTLIAWLRGTPRVPYSPTPEPTSFSTMCGIAGIFSPDLALSRDNLSQTVRSMAFVIRHRGPDDAGAWVDASAGLVLGHARLAILDLSSAGHQPMVGTSGRYVIAFNGEIYNHLELRAEFDLPGFATFRRGGAAGEVARPGRNSPDQELNRYVPRALIGGPKAGFGIPIGQWLWGPLRNWAEDLLNESRLEREGYLRLGPIRREWAEHLRGQRD